ncbi:MAG: lipopolysaccharide heptosyltransferase II [Candidatus Gastranaerophilales bacterium]|nr:lipopolysaccharide heptosyltransferase II [Candidatus Gastranaerophilales bacterium]
MKILVVRYRFIGDMILTIPFLRNLRYKYPDAQIDMLVSPNSGEILEGCPYVNNFIFFDTTRKHKYENGKGKKKSFFSYVKELKKNKYDKAYVLKRSFSSALLCFLAGIKERIGYDTENRGFLLTKKVKYDLNKHESLCFLDVLKAEGAEIKDTYLENWVSEKDTKKIMELFKDNHISSEIKKAVVNVTATNEGKVWDISNFARIIEYLSNKKNVQVIFIGAKSDKAVYENINYNEPLKIPPINLCGETTIKESLALLKETDFIIGNDTGTLHVASSIGIKVIGLYGPMPFEKWKALGDNNILLKADLTCMPCYLKKKCPNNKACLNAITIEQVKNAIDKVVN